MKVFVWENIIVLIDDGRAPASAYVDMADIASGRSRKYPAGFGVLTIIPQDSVPPSDEVRKAINKALEAQGDRLRCVCWCVEASGFQGATARAVLLGFRLFSKAHYPRHISTNLEDALGWMTRQLGGGDIQSANAFVIAQR